MRKNKKIYSIFQLASAVFMILALLWLTVSTPIVYASQQQQAKLEKKANIDTPLSSEEDATNPFSNTTEEKTPPSSTFSDEYLHDHAIEHHFFAISLQYHKCEDAGTYNAFHGELLVPPPNVA